MNKLVMKLITIIGIIIILLSNCNTILAVNMYYEELEKNANDVNNEWDEKLYGKGNGSKISVTFTKKQLKDIKNRIKNGESISFNDIKNNSKKWSFSGEGYSGMKKDIMVNRMIIECRKAKNNSTETEITINGIIKIENSNVEELTSKQQDDYLELIKNWKTGANTAVKGIESNKNNNKRLNLADRKKFSSLQEEIKNRISDADNLEKYLKSAKNNKKNVDKEVGKKSAKRGASTKGLSNEFDDAVNRSQEEIDKVEKLKNTELAERKLGYSNESISSKDTNIDETINEADDFIDKAETDKIDQSNLSKTIKSLYYILLGVAIVIAVIIGTYMAIKLITSSAEGKAKIKEMLVPYIVGCVVAFGAFGIWALVMKMFNAM